MTRKNGPDKGARHVAGGEARITIRPRSVAVDAVEPRADDALVERAVRHLRGVVLHGQVRLIIETGEYLIREFYGSEAEARSRSPKKARSLERLFERAGEFGMTASRLATVVPIALAARDLGLELSHDLGVSRLRVLAPVRDAGKRRLLAQTASASGWTVAKLKERVNQVQQPHAGGRPARPPLLRAVSRIERVFDTETADLGSPRTSLDGISPREARQLLERVMRIRARTEKLEKMLLRVAERPPTRR